MRLDGKTTRLVGKSARLDSTYVILDHCETTRLIGKTARLNVNTAG